MKDTAYITSGEPLYDSEPAEVRAEMYRSLFEKYATHAAEYHKILIKSIDGVLKELEKRGYVHRHVRYSAITRNFQKQTIYLSNETTKSMIGISIQDKDIEKCRIEETYWDHESEQEYDGRRFHFIAIQTASAVEMDWFRKLIEKSKVEEGTQNKLFMIKSSDFGGTELDPFPIENVHCDIETNYGKGFLSVNEKVIESLKDKKSGLYIFHGPPGTGKTSYIRYLTTVVPNRKFILVPNTMVATIFSPKMIQNIYSFKNSVLILEDAELCVFKRDGTNNELVSGILNITDGLLKDLLNISIFVTFNSSRIDELDRALLRKGRLKAMYKFDALPVVDAQKLLNKIKKPYTVNTPMTLAELYNIDDEVDLGGEIVPESATVGFGNR